MELLTRSAILALPKRKRSNLMNYVSGFKSANLIGTISSMKVTNLAIFNSVVHIGANPPYLGFILRPLTVARHTFQNIEETGFYTINHINVNIYQKAHQTSAKYEEDISEFDAVGLTPEFKADFLAPYVEESHLKMGLSLQEVKHIDCNDTLLVIGKVEALWLPNDCYDENGHLDLSALETIAIGGLDTYYTTQKLERLAYARP